jgi:aspartate ammonia-lyase
VERLLMLVTAPSPVIGYGNVSKIAHYTMDNDLTLKASALKLGFVTEAELMRQRGVHHAKSPSRLKTVCVGAGEGRVCAPRKKD